jgi:hypothetical protein
MPRGFLHIYFNDQRPAIRTARLAGLIAAPLEAACLWGLYAWIQLGLHGNPPMAAFSKWGLLVALAVHLPALSILLAFHSTGILFWPTLFLVGYGEWFILIVALTVGYQALQLSRQLLKVAPIRRDRPRTSFRQG